MRRWRFALPVLVFCLGCALAWAGFVWARTSERPGGEVAAGQSWTSPKGFRMELVTYRVADQLRDEDGRVKRPLPGTKWVYVEVQFHDLPPGTGCRLVLSGEDRMTWDTAQDAPLMKGFSFCTEDGAGDSPLVYSVFQVPAALVPTVRGVLLDHVMQLRQPPLFRKP